MHFTKMQGLGNDYVYVNCLEEEPRELPALARIVSDRHLGIGSDGLICICPSDCADFRMRMFNADGSEGEMCGNGIRCFGKYVFDQHLTAKTGLSVETRAGIRTLELHVGEDGMVSSVTVDMGAPEIGAPCVLTVLGKEYTVYPISMGNPHAVVFEPSISQLRLEEIGPHFECHPVFPDRTNTEFAEVVTRDRVKMRVWERGSGETMACGTGACAVLVASVLAGKAQRSASIELPGGELLITWDDSNGHVFMTGPAVTVFEGEWPE